MNIHFLYPSGNPTAIVCHKPNNPNQKYFIGGKIIEKYPSIEQVGFLYKENNNFTLEMTGNELCINASLSAFFLINKIYTKKVDIIYLYGKLSDYNNINIENIVIKALDKINSLNSDYSKYYYVAKDKELFVEHKNDDFFNSEFYVDNIQKYMQ